jgi:hypothetical protein
MTLRSLQSDLGTQKLQELESILERVKFQTTRNLGPLQRAILLCFVDEVNESGRS